MWICLNKAFFSVVQHKEDSNVLVVRARRSGDIETYFPGAKVTVTPNRDYKYRIHTDRDSVERMLVKQVQNLDYTNFKNSVRDRKLHDAYSDFWGTMYSIQE